MLDIPPAWDWSADQIVQHRWRKILVLGGVDRGKSTYCRFLTRRCLETGQRVAVVDTDVGQKDIGPPATLTLGYPEVAQALAEVLPAAAEIAEAADVFLERGAFDAAQARRYLDACAGAGLALRLHGDQFTEQGAVPLAIELGARSVDHLEATGDEGVAALGKSDVAAVLLPASALFLDRPMPPGRALVEAGAVVALATDFNPGSAFCESLAIVCSLAATQLRLSPAEALAACTVNAAHVLGRSNTHGRLARGYAADIVLLEAADWRYLAYHLGANLVTGVVLQGEPAELG